MFPFCLFILTPWNLKWTSLCPLVRFLVEFKLKNEIKRQKFLCKKFQTLTCKCERNSGTVEIPSHVVLLLFNPQTDETTRSTDILSSTRANIWKKLCKSWPKLLVGVWGETNLTDLHLLSKNTPNKWSFPPPPSAPPPRLFFSVPSRPQLLTFRFQSGLLLLGGSEGRPGHADGQQGQQDCGQQPGPWGHPVSGGQRSPYPPSPPPPGHWSHLRGSAQPSTAAGSPCHSVEFTQSPGLERWRREGEKGRRWRSDDLRDRSVNRKVSKRRKNKISYRNYSHFKDLLSAPFFSTLFYWQSETEKMKRGKRQRHWVLQNAVKQAMPQTYQSCEAPAVNTQPTCIYLYCFSSVIICTEKPIRRRCSSLSLSIHSPTKFMSPRITQLHYILKLTLNANLLDFNFSHLL